MIGEAGVCQVHKIPLMFMGREDELSAGCVKCVADQTPKTGVPQTYKDPGADYFGAGPDKAPTKQFSSVEVKPVFSFNQSLLQAIAILQSLPMPKDLKQFKLINKVIVQLESLTLVKEEK